MLHIIDLHCHLLLPIFWLFEFVFVSLDLEFVGGVILQFVEFVEIFGFFLFVSA